MLKKLFSRRAVSEDEMLHLEARLQAALVPVPPRPEYIAETRRRLMASRRRQQAAEEAVPAGLWRALARYGSAMAALTGLRLWSILLTLAMLALGRRKLQNRAALTS